MPPLSLRLGGRGGMPLAKQPSSGNNIANILIDDDDSLISFCRLQTDHQINGFHSFVL